MKSQLITYATLNPCKRTVTSPSSSSSSSLYMMEILRPALINIHGRIYRKNAVQEESYEEEEDDYSYSEAGMCFLNWVSISSAVHVHNVCSFTSYNAMILHRCWAVPGRALWRSRHPADRERLPLCHRRAKCPL